MPKTMFAVCNDMLQQSEPDDYVLASGEAHSVREFAQEGFF